jgi:MFS family permease
MHSMAGCIALAGVGGACMITGATNYLADLSTPRNRAVRRRRRRPAAAVAAAAAAAATHLASFALDDSRTVSAG